MLSSLTVNRVLSSVETIDEGRVVQVRTPFHPTVLRMARSMGDFYLKQRTDLPDEEQIVTACPDVTVVERSSRCRMPCMTFACTAITNSFHIFFVYFRILLFLVVAMYD